MKMFFIFLVLSCVALSIRYAGKSSREELSAICYEWPSHEACGINMFLAYESHKDRYR